MSVGSLLNQTDSAVIWRGPRKTQLIKRFLKDTFWGRLDYLFFGELIWWFNLRRNGGMLSDTTVSWDVSWLSS